MKTKKEIESIIKEYEMYCISLNIIGYTNISNKFKTLIELIKENMLPEEQDTLTN